MKNIINLVNVIDCENNQFHEQVCMAITYRKKTYFVDFESCSEHTSDYKLKLDIASDVVVRGISKPSDAMMFAIKDAVRLLPSVKWGYTKFN